jgi:hypothetical protein
MSDFEFVFALFGLLLGLSLVELLGGFSRTIEAELWSRRAGEKAFRVGWLTPLLGLFVMIDIVTFWLAAWGAREQLAVSGRVLLSGLFFAGSYYLAASLVFPREPSAWRDLDDHYLVVRRLIMGSLLVLALVQLAYTLTLPGMLDRLNSPFAIVSIASINVLMLAAIVLPGRKAAAIVLGALILRYFYYFYLR